MPVINLAFACRSAAIAVLISSKVWPEPDQVVSNATFAVNECEAGFKPSIKPTKSSAPVPVVGLATVNV